MKKTVLILMLCSGMYLLNANESNGTNQNHDQSQEQGFFAQAKKAVRYCFTTQDGFFHVLHKSALAIFAVKGALLIKAAPKESRPYFSAALAYGLYLAYYFKIKTFASEKYFEQRLGGDPSDVGTILEQYINSQLPSGKDGIEELMGDSTKHTEIAKKIKKIFPESDRCAIQQQLQKDIEYLFDWYVPCSSFMAWFRRTFNGGKRNYAMQQIDDFSTQEVEGAPWGFMNLFDLRFGSSGYKLKMMKMVLLKKLLES